MRKDSREFSFCFVNIWVWSETMPKQVHFCPCKVNIVFFISNVFFASASSRLTVILKSSQSASKIQYSGKLLWSFSRTSFSVLVPIFKNENIRVVNLADSVFCNRAYVGDAVITVLLQVILSFYQLEIFLIITAW